MKRKINLLTSSILGLTLLFSCGGNPENNDSKTENTDNTTSSVENVEAPENMDPMKNKGIGPITNITLEDIDQNLVEAGEKLFTEKCSACHKVEKKYIGPGMAGILERRTPEWTMNMIMNTEQMVTEDPIAKQLLAEYLSPMANQSLTEEETRSILEYFRTL